MSGIFRGGIWIGLALLIASCATLSENTLPQNKRDNLRIDSVELSFAPDASINWPDVFFDFEKSGRPDTPAGRIAFLEQRAGGKIRGSMQAQIRSQFRGTEPARLRVVIRRLEVPSLLQRVLIGGGNAIWADVTLTDGKTAQVLLSADFRGTAYAAQGLSAVVADQLMEEAITRVSTNFGQSLARWLKTGNAL